MVLMIIPLIKEFNSHAVDPTYIVMQQCNILFPFFFVINSTKSMAYQLCGFLAVCLRF